MIERVAGIITRYSMFAHGSRVGVAVSGGADSVCLLHLLHQLSGDWDLHLTVLHVDHGLRGEESRADAEFVRALAAELNLPFSLHAANLPPGENLEQAARHARQQFFAGQMRNLPLDCVATAHTRSDQAETVLFRFLRGSGTAGLAGIRPVTPQGLVRPLIECDRAEVEEYLRARDLAWREDSTNATLQFARNRIRHELLPQLARDWNPAISETLAQTADWAQAEEAYWEAETARLSAALLIEEPAAVLARSPAVAALPLAAARRLVRLAMEKVKGDLRGIGFAHIEAVLALTTSSEGHGRVQAPGLDIFRSFDWLRFGHLGEYSMEGRNYSQPANAPGFVRIPAAGVDLALELIEKPETIGDSRYVYNSESYLDWDRVSGSLILRNWRPGDQYQPAGSSHEEKIKTMFQTARVPIWERRHWPVLLDGPLIVWSRRFGPAIACAANAGSRTVLRVRESKVPGTASID